MKAHIDPSFVKKAIAVSVLLLLIKLLWFVVEIVWLPAKGVDHAEGKRVKALYYRIRLTPNESAAPKITKFKPVKESHIRDIKLLAVYRASDETVVTVLYRGKAKVLAKGETVNGFQLEDAGSKFAIFTKNGKQYRVTLISSKQGAIKYKTIPASKEAKQDDRDGEEVDMDGVVDAGDHKIVDRSLIEHYTKDMKSIYKDIGIQEIRSGKQIDGFRVTYIKRGTPFSKLGLRRGDVLKSINGEALDSYNAAFEAYKNINDATSVTLTIERGKKEMELEYEIN